MYLKKYADIAEMPTSAGGVSRAELLPSQRVMLDEAVAYEAAIAEERADQAIAKSVAKTQPPSPKQLEMMRDFLSMNRQRRRSIIAAMKREAKKASRV